MELKMTEDIKVLGKSVGNIVLTLSKNAAGLRWIHKIIATVFISPYALRQLIPFPTTVGGKSFQVSACFKYYWRIAKMDEEKNKITVYFDGACPKCVNDRRNYEKLAGKSGENILWIDITGREELLRESGIDPYRALTELHVRDENDNILSEIDAYILLLGKVPLLSPLAWLIDLPLIRPLLSQIYRRQVKRRLRRSGRL